MGVFDFLSGGSKGEGKVVNPDAPVFNQSVIDKYAEAEKNGYRTNCFEFAFSGNRKPDYSYPNPGESSSITYHQDSEFKSVSGLVKKIESEGAKYTGKDFPKEKGYYAVAMFQSTGPDKDFHFMHENRDGTWSHSPGTNVGVEHVKDKNDDEIEKEKPHEFRNYGVYNFKGYFLVPKEGIDVGYDGYFQKRLAQGATVDDLAKEVQQSVHSLDSKGDVMQLNASQEYLRSALSIEDKKKAKELGDKINEICKQETGMDVSGKPAQTVGTKDYSADVGQSVPPRR